MVSFVDAQTREINNNKEANAAAVTIRLISCLERLLGRTTSKYTLQIRVDLDNN